MNRVLVILPRRVQNAVNAAIRSTGIDPGPADNITVPLWPVGADQSTTQPSHYWASWSMTDEQLTKLRGIGNINSPVDIYVYDLDTQPGFPQAKLAELGLTTAISTGPL